MKVMAFGDEGRGDRKRKKKRGGGGGVEASWARTRRGWCSWNL